MLATMRGSHAASPRGLSSRYSPAVFVLQRAEKLRSWVLVSYRDQHFIDGRVLVVRVKRPVVHEPQNPLLVRPRVSAVQEYGLPGSITVA